MAQNRVYQDFRPPHDWTRDERSDTLIIPLEGFLREQLRVQISSPRKIRVSGERQIEGNIWRRFYMEFPVPQDLDTNDIGAKFEKGTLYVRFPKLIAPAVMPPQLTRRPRTQQAPPPPPPPPPPPKPTTREELKAEEAIEMKPETKKDETKMEQKEKEPPKEYKKEDISEGNKEEKAKAKAPATTEDRKKQAEKSRRAPFSEGLSSMQGQDYKDTIVGLVGELKKQKNWINMLVVVFVVLLLGLYLKHLVVSSFGGSSKSHQEL